jgi:hypothetical protein
MIGWANERDRWTNRVTPVCDDTVLLKPRKPLIQNTNQNSTQQNKHSCASDVEWWQDTWGAAVGAVARGAAVGYSFLLSVRGGVGRRGVGC